MLTAIPLLAVVFLLLLFWRRRIIGMIGEQRLVAAQLTGRIRGRVSLKAILQLVALSLVIIGAANLQAGGRPEQVQRKGVDVLIALDVSKSMLAEDLQPDRLTRARQLIERLLDKLRDDRVGLIIFAGRAYLSVPLTIDYSAMRMMLQNARPDLVPTQGTAIGEAIDLAIRSFSQKERKYKSLIIISDGEDHEEKADERARAAAESGVVIHTVGIGSPQGAPLFDEITKAPKLDESGQQVISRLNESALKSIAAVGKGTYVLLRNGDAAASALADNIDGMEGRNMGTVSYTDYNSYFQFFLLPALLLLLGEWLIPGARSPRKWNTE